MRTTSSPMAQRSVARVLLCYLRSTSLPRPHTNDLKVVLKSAKKDDSNLAREIHHHRQFVHPHIARLYEVIVTESMVWLVLEYCPGMELLHRGVTEEDKANTPQATNCTTTWRSMAAYQSTKSRRLSPSWSELFPMFISSLASTEISSSRTSCWTSTRTSN